MIKPWHVIAATVTACVVAVSGVGVVGYQQYSGAQTAALEEARSALSLGQDRIRQVTERIADLELALDNAESVYQSSQGKTLDEKARQALRQEITQAKKL